MMPIPAPAGWLSRQQPLSVLPFSPPGPSGRFLQEWCTTRHASHVPQGSRYGRAERSQRRHAMSTTPFSRLSGQAQPSGHHRNAAPLSVRRPHRALWRKPSDSVHSQVFLNLLRFLKDIPQRFQQLKRPAQSSNHLIRTEFL